MANVVFVAPYALDATTRFLSAVTEVPETRVGLVSSDPVERFPSAVQLAVAGHWRTENCLDADQLTAAVSALGGQLGSVDRLVAILENLQVPLGEVRDRLGIAGLSAATAENFRDKARMKAAFEHAGVPCATSGRAESAEQAADFAGRVGFPFVAKPLAGAGARNTFRIEDHDQLQQWLAAAPPSPQAPDAAGGVRARRGALLRQRRRRRPSRLALDQPLPAEPARRARASVDPVVRAPATRHRRR